MIQQFETTDDEKGAVFNDSGISGESFGSADVAEGETSTTKFGMFKKNLSRSESLKSKVRLFCLQILFNILRIYHY